MKNSTLLSIAMALALVATVGCRTNAPKTTPLPGTTGISDTTGGGSSRTPDLTTPGMRGQEGTTGGTGPVGSQAGTPSDLPDDAKLADRPQDRTKFAGETVHFDYDRSNVKAGDVAKVERVASQFKSLPPGHDLLIEGHCDERGTEGYNQALGEHRALAIRELLVRSGVDGQHVFTKSLGKDHPVNPGHDETAWAQNRRGEFILVLPKKSGTTQNSQ